MPENFLLWLEGCVSVCCEANARGGSAGWTANPVGQTYVALMRSTLWSVSLTR
jgi:hypothetical protein